MKARKLSYWIGLFCVAVLVLMPDITVNAQPDPGGQRSNGQAPDEVEGTDTQTSEGQGPSNEVDQGTDTQTSAEQQIPEGQGPSNQEPTQPVQQRMRVAEQSLIEIGCQYASSFTNPPTGSVWREYQCPPGNKFDIGPPISSIVGYQPWDCLVSPDRIPSYGEEDIRSGECVPPIGGGGAISEPTANGRSPREVNVTQIPEPASSDSEGESDQQQAQGDVTQVDEEVQDEEDKASNQSQESNNPTKGYGCSANA